MCNPALAVAGLQFAATAYNQHQSAKFQAATFEANKQLADANALRQYTLLQTRQQQEQAKAADAVQQTALHARATMAAGRVAAGEAGVAGNSVDALLQDFSRTELHYQRTAIRNQAFLDANYNSEAEAIRLGQQAQINQAVPGQQPGLLGPAVNLFGRALSIQYQMQNDRNPYEGT